MVSLQRIRCEIAGSPERAASRSSSACPRSRAPASDSTTSTSYPARAAASAMPEPIVPPPTTKTPSAIDRAPSREELQTLRHRWLDMKKPRWRLRQSSYLVDSPYMRLRVDEVELPDGTVVPNYYVRESRGFVTILA